VDAGTGGGDSGLHADGARAPGDAGSASGCDCAHGACVALGGSIGATACECEPHFAGELCDICAPGYEGAACDACGAGYAPSAEIEGLCEPDPCDGVDCSGHGTCSTDVTPTGVVVARCACEPAYLGDVCELCARGYEGADCTTCSAGYSRVGTECVAIACVGVSCSEHGTCGDADGDGAGECVCEPGWGGRACEACAAGYVLDARECVPDACIGVDCGHGACVPRPTGPVCSCDDGWTGASCDACAAGYTMRTVGDSVECLNELPIRDRRLGCDYDASAAWTITTLSPDLIDTWHNRYSTTGTFGRLGVASAPRRLLIPAAIEFDGVDDALYSISSPTIRAVDTYSVFLVVSWGPTDGWQTILDSYYPIAGGKAYSLEALDGHTLRFRHHDGTSRTSDTVTSSHFDASAGPQLVVIERRPFLAGTAITLSNGTDRVTEVATNGAFPEAPLGVIGRCLADAGPVPDCHLHGRLHEYVIYNGALTAAERDAVAAYLRVKWGTAR